MPAVGIAPAPAPIGGTGTEFTPLRAVVRAVGVVPAAGVELAGQIDLTARNPQKITNRNGGPVKVGKQAGRYEVIPGMSAADVADRARATITAYDRAIVKD